jgi:hypothetical protein
VDVVTVVWTPADQAELDVLAHELVRVVFDHREGCETCQVGGECRRLHEGLRDALDAIMDWKTARELRSRAERLRREAA